MRCTILHETTGRMRVGLRLRTLSMEQADTLEAYLRSFSFVRLAKVDERTCHALIRFTPGERAAVIGALSSFDFSSKDLPEVAHSSRAISRHYQDKMIFHVVRRFLIRRLLPFPVRQVLTTLKAIPYLKRGLASLSQKKLGVSVLDAASITVSLLRREFDTAGSIMFLLKVGDIMEEWTHKKSVEDLAGVMALNVDKVWIRTPQGQEVLLPLSRVKTGDVGLVRAGNMIPLDGEVIEGEATVNQASLTGEALPVPKRCGSTIYAGTVVEEGEISFRVKEAAGESRYERIITMIEDSEKLKSVSEAKASRLADRLVPWTFLASGATFLLTRSVARATSILMVDFCCALKLSMPIAVLSAMREAGERQIIAKGGKFLEKMAEADTIVFDKTGTLTEAVPTVKDIVPFGGNDPQEILRLAACLEEHFPHSIANAVVECAKEKGILHEERHAKVELIVAHGIASSIDGKRVCIGSHHFLFEDEGCRIPAGEEERFAALPDAYSHLYMALEGELCAVLLIEDPLKKEAASAICALHGAGFTNIVMMTGDSERTARAVAKTVGVDAYYAEVLPEDKASFVQAEREKGHVVVMVGDGINDSPALSAADVGLAINSGAAIAREIADITLQADDLFGLLYLRRLSLALMKRTEKNYREILSFNAGLILLGALGILPSRWTALLHNASTVAISLASMQILKEEAPSQPLLHAS